MVAFAFHTHTPFPWSGCVGLLLPTPCSWGTTFLSACGRPKFWMDGSPSLLPPSPLPCRLAQHSRGPKAGGIIWEGNSSVELEQKLMHILDGSEQSLFHFARCWFGNVWCFCCCLHRLSRICFYKTRSPTDALNSMPISSGSLFFTPRPWGCGDLGFMWGFLLRIVLMLGFLWGAFGRCFVDNQKAQLSTYPPASTLISMGFGHVVSFLTAVNGSVVLALELHRMPNISFSWMSSDLYTTRFSHEVWAVAWPMVQTAYRALDLQLPRVFDMFGIDCYWLVQVPEYFFPKCCEHDWVARTTEGMLHHQGHASFGFYDSPFDSALVVSMDGGGWEGAFQIYVANRTSGLANVASPRVNFGYAYGILSRTKMTQGPADLMSLSVMGALKQDRGIASVFDVSPLRKDFYNVVRTKAQRLKKAAGSQVQDYAATVQAELEKRVLSQLKTHLPQPPQVQGLVLTGGVALNARLNSRIQAAFGRPVHVPPEPGDEGLGTGWAWLLHPPSLEDRGQPFIGLPLLDKHTLPLHVARHGAVPADPQTVASTLAHGRVLALVRGRASISPLKGLGHRNIIASTHIEGMADRLRRLVRLKPFRYVGVIATDAAAAALFQGPALSPYMSFTPTLKQPHRHREMCLRDGSVLLQTITQQQDPWLHAVLEQLGRACGVAAVLTVEFFVDGLKRATYVVDALSALDSPLSLDAVVFEDWLFNHTPPKA